MRIEEDGILHRRRQIVKRLAVPVLAHRVLCGGLIHEGQRQRAKQVIEQILNVTPVRL